MPFDLDTSIFVVALWFVAAALLLLLLREMARRRPEAILREPSNQRRGLRFFRRGRSSRRREG